MYKGKYILFEGVDFSGKSTLSHLVLDKLQVASWPTGPIQLTSHPGATNLGKHLRVLSKTPQVFNENIVIDPLSRQLLMFIDQICFINTILIPWLEDGGMMLADRSNYISGIVYGLTQGATLQSLNRMFGIAKSPAPDIVFIVQTPFDIIIERRLKDQRSSIRDTFDADTEFMRKICTFYDNLLTANQDVLLLLSDYVPLERIVYIDGTRPPDELVDIVIERIKSLIMKTATTA